MEGIYQPLLLFGIGLIAAIGLYVALIVLVGRMAQNRNRDVLLWVVLCFVVSPITIILILICIGKDEKIGI
ncbi:MAG: hypothetical protein IKH43_06925 [Bacteroidaceae bacterium]|nr:hypothetical protein [Bacteroidaceae bacterium]